MNLKFKLFLNIRTRSRRGKEIELDDPLSPIRNEAKKSNLMTCAKSPPETMEYWLFSCESLRRYDLGFLGRLALLLLFLLELLVLLF